MTDLKAISNNRESLREADLLLLGGWYHLGMQHRLSLISPHRHAHCGFLPPTARRGILSQIAFLILFHWERLGWGWALWALMCVFLNCMRTIFSFSSLAVSGFPVVALCLYLGSVTRSNYGLKIWLLRSKTAGLLVITKQGPSVAHNTCLTWNLSQGPQRDGVAAVLPSQSPKAFKVQKRFLLQKPVKPLV